MEKENVRVVEKQEQADFVKEWVKSKDGKDGLLVNLLIWADNFYFVAGDELQMFKMIEEVTKEFNRFGIRWKPKEAWMMSSLGKEDKDSGEGEDKGGRGAEEVGKITGEGVGATYLIKGSEGYPGGGVEIRRRRWIRALGCILQDDGGTDMEMRGRRAAMTNRAMLDGYVYM